MARMINKTKPKRESETKTGHSAERASTTSPKIGDIQMDTIYKIRSLMPIQREVLEQLDLCNRIARDTEFSSAFTPSQRASVTHAVTQWSVNLAVYSEAAQFALRDIVDEPDPAKRAAAFLAIISSAVDDLPSPSENLKRFLLHVAWHEGAKLKTRKQGGNGPARSFFQFEAYRAREALEYARQKLLYAKLATASGKTEAELKTAEEELPKKVSEPYFPQGNLIESLLLTNDTFGCFLARIAFLKIPESIGTTNDAHAEYWFKYWKVTDPDPPGQKAKLKAAADEVDNLLP